MQTRQQQYDQQALDSLRGRFPAGSTVEGSVVSLPVPPGTALDRLAVGSIRVSKGRDTMISPEIQWDSIIGFCTSRGLVLSRVFLDMHKSGRKFEKRAVIQIVEDIKHRKYSAVVLWKWSRWGRNASISGMYVNEVESSGGKVYAATEDIDTSTAIGKFHRGFMFQLAEFESNQKGEQWREVHGQRRNNGLPHTSNPRFGYTYSSESGYTVDPDEAELLRDAYEKFVGGTSMYALSNHWNSRGVRTRQGSAWNPTSLGRMLDTGFAAGLIRERSTPGTASNNSRTLASFDVWRDGAQEAIIDMPLWESYKDKRRANAATAPRLVRATHPLTGLMTCRECGRTMVSVYSGKHKKHTWSCRKVMTERLHAPVTLSNLRAEAVALAWIMSEVEGGAGVEDAARARRAQSTAVTDIHALELEVSRLVAKRSRLSDLATDGLIDREDFVRQKDEIQQGLTRANDAIAQAKAAAIPADDRGALYRGLLDTWGIASNEQKNQLLRSVVRCFLVGPGRFQGPVDFDKMVPVSLWDV